MDTTLTLPPTTRRTLADLARAENTSEADIVVRALAAYSQLRADAADDARWDALSADPASERLLESMARDVRAEIAAGRVLPGDPATR